MKVAWMTWLPINGGVSDLLRLRLRENGHNPVLRFVEPKRQFDPDQCLALVEEMNREYDVVALTVNSEMAEAIRNFKILNYQKPGAKFAQWFSLAVKEGGTEFRWCAVG